MGTDEALSTTKPPLAQWGKRALRRQEAWRKGWAEDKELTKEDRQQGKAGGTWRAKRTPRNLNVIRGVYDFSAQKMCFSPYPTWVNLTLHNMLCSTKAEENWHTKKLNAVPTDFQKTHGKKTWRNIKGCISHYCIQWNNEEKICWQIFGLVLDRCWENLSIW